MKSLPALALVALLTSHAPQLSQANPPNPPNAPDAPNAHNLRAAESLRVAQAAPSRPLPFHGKLTAVDAEANTITVGKRVFHVTADTKIVRDGAPAKLADAMVGDKVGGAYVKEEDGVMRLTSVRFGDKPAPKDPS